MDKAKIDNPVVLHNLEIMLSSERGGMQAHICNESVGGNAGRIELGGKIYPGVCAKFFHYI